MRVALCRAACASAPVFGLANAYSATLGIDGDAHRPRQQRPRRLAYRRPGGQRIDGRRHRIEIAAQPAGALRRRRIGGRPDVGALEMRAARVRVAGALDDREPAGVEDGAQAGQPRVQAERVAGAVGPDLQHVGRRNRQGRPAREVLRIGVGDQRAQPVVSAAQVQHDQVAPRPPLRAGDVGQKRRRREADGERRHAAPNEIASVHRHDGSIAALDL